MMEDFEAALARCKRIGAGKADDDAVMAAFCQSSLQTLVGAASPRLVWEGARKSGITSRELLALCSSSPDKVHDLMWV